jgi:anaerobic selenocysteine-containing dehydrogenase
MVMMSPMLSCEDAFALACAARAMDSRAVFAMGPVPMAGEDKTFPAGNPKGYRIYAEKAPNARGVRRVLGAFSKDVLAYDAAVAKLKTNDVGAVIVTGNYPSNWVTPELAAALEKKTLVVIDTLRTLLSDRADVLLPSCTWVEKAGTFENANGLLQAFEQAIPTVGDSRAEGQIGHDLLGFADPVMAAELSMSPMEFVSSAQGVRLNSSVPGVSRDPNDNIVSRVEEGGAMPQDAVQVLRTTFNAAQLREHMAKLHPEELGTMARDVRMPSEATAVETDMAMVEL